MARAYLKTDGDLADRLLAALESAQEKGGDIHGMQSAALLVENNIKDESPWKHLIADLRVDDHPHPLKELRRLLRIQNAYALMNQADEFLLKEQNDKAKKICEAVAKIGLNNDELKFWQAVTMVEICLIDKALPIFKTVFKKNKNWVLLVQRLPESEMLSDSPELMRKILSVQE